MAKDSAAKKEKNNEVAAESSSEKAKKPILLIILVFINLIAVVAVGIIVYMGQKQKIAGENPLGDPENVKINEVVSEEDSRNKIVSLDTFLVNLVGDRGRKLIKVNMELEVSGEGILDEVTKQKPKIRDMIITITSSKVYSDISSKEGKENLRNEIKDQINLFLTKGKIEKIFFTEFLYN